MVYNSPPVGSLISYSMWGINKKLIKDNLKLEDIFYRALEEDNFNILERSKHKFKPCGITLNAILSESDASMSTYIEYNKVVFHLESCRRPNDGKKACDYLKKNINPLSELLITIEIPIDPDRINKYKITDRFNKESYSINFLLQQHKTQ